MTDRERSARFHARRRAEHEWLEANRQLLEYLATSPDVPEQFRPAGGPPPRLVDADRPVVAQPRPDPSRRPAGATLRPVAPPSRPVAPPSRPVAPPSRPVAPPPRPDPTGRPLQSNGADLRPILTAAAPSPPAGRSDRPDEGVGGVAFSLSQRERERPDPPNPPAPAGRPAGDALFVSLVEQAGVPLVLTRADRRAIRRSEAAPELIAEAYVAAARGEWCGDGWTQERLNPALVVKRLSGYEIWKAQPHAPKTLNGSYRPSHNPRHI